MSAGKPSKAEHLARVARRLKPARAPFYVQHGGMDPTTPLVGWYWQPAGSPLPLPLGANYEQCLMTLSLLIAQSTPTAQAA